MTLKKRLLMTLFLLFVGFSVIWFCVQSTHFQIIEATVQEIVADDLELAIRSDSVPSSAIPTQAREKTPNEEVPPDERNLEPSQPDSKQPDVPQAPKIPDDPKIPEITAAVSAGQEWAGNHLEMRFCWCPPGRFRMGEGPWAVDVMLNRGFWIGKTEVTQSQWTAVMKVPQKEWRTNANTRAGKNYPASWVSWTEATEFCVELSKQECAARLLPLGWEYRLPTDAQWEYASRAGTQTAYSFGDTASQIGDYAWNRKNTTSQQYAHQVGRKKANPWGLHDCCGNVVETLWKRCGNVVETLWKRCGNVVETLWNGVEIGIRKVYREDAIQKWFGRVLFERRVAEAGPVRMSCRGLAFDGTVRRTVATTE
jgi:formylglycine-generating enzyme required for sulfatase activity